MRESASVREGANKPTQGIKKMYYELFFNKDHPWYVKRGNGEIFMLHMSTHYTQGLEIIF